MSNALDASIPVKPDTGRVSFFWPNANIVVSHATVKNNNTLFIFIDILVIYTIKDGIKYILLHFD
jgi:hypothetical protein